MTSTTDYNATKNALIEDISEINWAFRNSVSRAEKEAEDAIMKLFKRYESILPNGVEFFQTDYRKIRNSSVYEEQFQVLLSYVEDPSSVSKLMKRHSGW